MKCWPGMHRWEVVGTLFKHPFKYESDYYLNTTLCVSKCKDCGKLKTHELKGQWTVDQLRKKENDDGQR